MKSRANLWLLAAVVLCGLSLWAGFRSRDRESGAGEPPGETPVHLLVLNGTGQSGLARQISLLLGPAGCVVEGVGNAPAGDWPHCLLVNRRLSPRRAANLAGILGGVDVVREWDDRSSEDAVLILGQDWPGLREALAGDAGK